MRAQRGCLCGHSDCRKLRVELGGSLLRVDWVPVELFARWKKMLKVTKDVDKKKAVIGSNHFVAKVFR